MNDTSNAPPFRLPGHIPALDVIRGIAIVLVLFHNEGVLENSHTAAGKALSYLSYIGYVGVILFFALSGFLITGILSDTRHSPNALKSFYGRRTLRIFPLYYAALLVTFVVAPLAHVALPSGGSQVWFWLYLKNWNITNGRSMEPLPHFWSLCVEEQFYLCWPFVVRALSPRRLIGAALFFAAVSIAARAFVVEWPGGEDGSNLAYMNTICRMDALVLGGAAAMLLRDEAARGFILRHPRAIFLAAIGVLFFGWFPTGGYARSLVVTETVGYFLLALTFTALLVIAVLADVGNWSVAPLLRNRPLRALGKYSYGMYVVHMPLHLYVTHPLFEKWTKDGVSLGAAVMYLAFGIVAAFALAFVSYHAFEKHFLALKSRFVAEPAAQS